jgi:NAD(P)-dependent dehydrogenase (short-subunit alcohol dehydrogenase family)
MNRVALVTGGTRGIGLGIARALAADGLDLALCGRRDADEVAGTLEALSGPDTDVLYEPADVSDLDAHERLLDAIDARYGRLDVLVNNAGVAPRERNDLLEATPESFDRVLDINLRGPYFLTQQVANWMVDQQGDEGEAAFDGAIVNVTSISSTVASPNRGEYCISKAGLTMATRLWAVRLSEFGIPVYEVRPGIVDTDMTSAAKEKYDRLLLEEGLTLEPRWGQPEDVGSAVATLVRGDLPYATGHAVHIDGGLTIDRL